MQTYQSTPDFYRDYISHHGILGMHWGKRNGPPYPLGASDHSASEKKAGWRKSLSSGSNSSSGTNKVKKAVQGIRRKTKKYNKDLEEYKNNIWRKTYNRRDQANTTKWANEEKDENEKNALLEYAKWYKEDVDRNQKDIDKFTKKYGEHNLEDIFSKKELKEMKAQEKYTDSILNSKKNKRC